jgi:hypothetical protein
MQRGARGIATNLRVLGRLHDFQQVAWQGQPITADDRRAFIWCYLDARYHGTEARPELSALQWKPSVMQKCAANSARSSSITNFEIHRVLGIETGSPQVNI